MKHEPQVPEMVHKAVNKLRIWTSAFTFLSIYTWKEALKFSVRSQLTIAIVGTWHFQDTFTQGSSQLRSWALKPSLWNRNQKTDPNVRVSQAAAQKRIHNSQPGPSIALDTSPHGPHIVGTLQMYKAEQRSSSSPFQFGCNCFLCNSLTAKELTQNVVALGYMLN